MAARAVGLFLTALMFVTTGNAAIFSHDVEESLVRFINTTMTCRMVPGFTLSVVKGNETWSRGFGMADLDTGRKVTPNTLFGIGSLTKAMTVALLYEVLREKGLNWTSKVSDALEGFEFVDAERTSQMRIRDILAHRTGLARMDLGLIVGYPESINREQLAGRIKYLPAQVPFRDSFIYNNNMYMLAGYMAGKLAGESWEDAVTSHVFQPIGMNSSRVMKVTDDVLAENVARPYRRDGDALVNGTLSIYNIHPSEPAGAVLSSADDMAKWMRWNLHRLISTDKDLEKYKEVYQPHIAPPLNDKAIYRPLFPVDDTSQGYGYAWFASTYRGYRKIWHSGGLFSYISLLWLFPDLDVGIFASVNGPAHKKDDSYALLTIFNYIADHLIDETPWLNETTTCTFPMPWRNDTKEDSSSQNPTSEPDIQYTSFEEYEGSYGSQLLPDVQISSNSSNLIFRESRCEGPLLATPEKDKFKWKLVSPTELANSLLDPNGDPLLLAVNFTRDKTDGVVSSFVIVADSPVTFVKGTNFNTYISIVGGGERAVPSFFLIFTGIVAMAIVRLYNQ